MRRSDLLRWLALLMFWIAVSCFVAGCHFGAHAILSGEA
jgi:hypothetical protein